MRITLLRHGRPAFELKGHVCGRELAGIAKAYDLCGIVDTPPAAAREISRDADFVVCSHLERSIQSVAALGLTPADVSAPLFAESAIPHPLGGSVPLPITVWMVALRLMWILGYARNGESLADTRRRADRAATQLVAYAENHGQVLLVGHGFINHFIAKALTRRGWRGSAEPDRGYWGYGCYERKK